jgi:aminopeptidase
MTDPRIPRLAELLVNYCVTVKPGDKVMVLGGSAGLPLLDEVYRSVIRAGGHPFPVWTEESFMEILLREGSEEQIRHVAPPLALMTESYDCYIRVLAPSNTRTLASVDNSRQRSLREGMQSIMRTRMQRAAAGEMRWVGLIYPTQALAQEADMSLSEYEDFVYGACFVDKENPMAEWGKIHAMQQRMVDWLDGKREVKVTGPNADLSLSIAGRTFINSDGHRNMPSGEIFTGPVEDSVNGWVRFTYPAIYMGREVDGVELRFKDGKVVDATATKNEEFMISVLDTDAGSRYLGEFAVGTNMGIQRFTKSILFDEKIGGTIHMAVGAGYPETGSKNQSAVHWDMICDMRDGGQIHVDGELFYENGVFVV